MSQELYYFELWFGELVYVVNQRALDTYKILTSESECEVEGEQLLSLVAKSSAFWESYKIIIIIIRYMVCMVIKKSAHRFSGIGINASKLCPLVY